MAFTFEEQVIKGVFVITPQVFGDSRGYFAETFKAPDFAAHGIPTEYVQDNESCSSKGVFRGLHFQKTHTVELDSEKKQMFFIPAGFAHGFLVLSDSATFTYKCTDVYDPSGEGGIPWNDPTIAVDWPKLDIEYKTSEKDGKHTSFKDQSFEWAEKWL